MALLGIFSLLLTVLKGFRDRIVFEVSYWFYKNLKYYLYCSKEMWNKDMRLQRK